jgi:hypothetical protein
MVVGDSILESYRGSFDTIVLDLSCIVIVEDRILGEMCNLLYCKTRKNMLFFPIHCNIYSSDIVFCY